MEKVTLITGASGGLGKEFAYLAANDKQNLFLIARSTDKLNEIKKDIEKNYGVKVYVLDGDLSNEKVRLEIEKFAKKNDLFVNKLINNAGFGTRGDFTTVPYENHENLMDLNNKALVHLTYMFLPRMLKEHDGKILNIASIASYLPGPHMVMYFASKAFVSNFSNGLMKECKKQGVTVTALYPSPTNTGFLARSHMNEKLFKNAPSAKFVATKGYKGMMKGKMKVNPGAYPKFVNFFSKIVPVGMAGNIVEKQN